MGRVDPTAVYGYGYASLARLVPWGQQIQLQKYAKSNPEPDWSKVTGVRTQEDTGVLAGAHLAPFWVTQPADGRNERRSKI